MNIIVWRVVHGAAVEAGPIRITVDPDASPTLRVRLAHRIAMVPALEQAAAEALHLLRETNAPNARHVKACLRLERALRHYPWPQQSAEELTDDRA